MALSLARRTSRTRRRRQARDHLLRRSRAVPRRQRRRASSDARRRWRRAPRSWCRRHGLATPQRRTSPATTSACTSRSTPSTQLPLGSDHARAVAAVGRGRVPAHDRRPVGARRPRRGPARVPGPDRAGPGVGHRRHPPRAAPDGDHPAARVLRRLPRAGGRVPAAGPPAVHDHCGAGRVPVPPAGGRRGRRVPRPLRPRLAGWQSRACLRTIRRPRSPA